MADSAARSAAQRLRLAAQGAGLALLAAGCATDVAGPCVPLPDGACIVVRTVSAERPTVFDPTGEWHYDDLYYGEWLFELRLVGEMLLQGMQTRWRHNGSNIWLGDNGAVLLIDGPDMGYIWLDDGHGAEGPVYRR